MIFRKIIDLESSIRIGLIFSVLVVSVIAYGIYRIEAAIHFKRAENTRKVIDSLPEGCKIITNGYYEGSKIIAISCDGRSSTTSNFNNSKNSGSVAVIMGE